MKDTLFKFIFSLLHITLVLIITYIILFSSNICTLLITDIVLLCILVINYIFDDCPITLIEDKYHKNSSIDYLFSYTINVSGNKYNKKLRSLLTLELIWIILLLGVQKLLCLLLFKKFILKNIL